MLSLDPVTQASLEAATTPNARAAAVLASINGAVTVTVYDGSGNAKGSGTMTSLGTQSANVIVLGTTSDFEVTETGSPDPDSWTIRFENGSGKWLQGSFGYNTNPSAEFKWSLDNWTSGSTGHISNAFLTVKKTEVLSDVTDDFNVAAPPVNTAPYWLSNFPSSLTLTAGQTYNFAVHAADADGGTLTFSKVSGNGTVSSNGLYTAFTSGGNVVVRVSDGTLTTDATCAVTVAASGEWALDYPRTAVYWIGSYAWTTQKAEIASRFDVSILGWYPNRSDFGAYNSISSLGSAIKTYRPAVKLLVYTIPVNVGTDSSEWSEVRAKLAAESCGIHDWYLRNAAGTIIAPFGGATEGTNMTRFVDRDSNGWTWPQWFARYCNGKFGNGPFDGVFQDVVYSDGDVFGTTNSADWNGDGVNESDTSSTIENALAVGQADYVTEWASIQPTWWMIGNFLDVSRYPIPSAWQGLYHGGLQEFAMGLSWSVEEWGGWAMMMSWYRANLAALRSPYIGILHVCPDYLVSQYGLSPYRVLRYGLCSALMDNGWFAYSSDEYHTNTVWADEYNWNLGYPTQTPRTSAYSNGVYVREFDNGCAIVNPKGNGTRTITLPSAGSGKRWDRLSGSQDSTVNNGATNVTSVTINERDGLILKRVNA